jgi:hypothetical protein
MCPIEYVERSIPEFFRPNASSPIMAITEMVMLIRRRYSLVRPRYTSIVNWTTVKIAAIMAKRIIVGIVKRPRRYEIPARQDIRMSDL